jgi:Ca2+-transporting ATPase
MLGSRKGPKDSTADEQEKPKKGKKEDDPKANMTTHQHELAQDESVNPAPFRFKPFQLEHMLDPKDLDTVTALGGTEGIIRRLGTHSERGLTTTGGQLPQGAGQGALQSRDPEKQTESSESGGGLPNVTLTEPSGKEGLPDGDDNVPYTGTIDDRKRVYGENVLPTRISKMLLQLMFAAMKDKILVCTGERPLGLSTYNP